jgi:hypothetical protein
MKSLPIAFLYLLVIITLVPLFFLSGGCSGEGSSNNFHKLLELIPSDSYYAEYPMILFNHASYLADKNISLTKPNGDPVTFEEYIELMNQDAVGMWLTNGSTITGYGQYALAMTIENKYVGYDFKCIDAELEAGAPPLNIVAAVGKFNPQATKDALSHQEDWLTSIIEKYTTEEYRGVTIHSWGNGLEVDLAARLTPPHLDQIGRAKPLAVTEEYLFYPPTVDLIKLMIDASQDKAESLADLPEFSAIADALFEMNTYAAIIGDEKSANGNPDYEGTYPGPKLKKFITFASGLAEDEKGSYMVLVIYHENSNDAEANIPLMEERIVNTYFPDSGQLKQEVFTDIDIYAEGKVLKAKLYTTRIGGWSSWFYERAPLLLHEQ